MKRYSLQPDIPDDNDPTQGRLSDVEQVAMLRSLARKGSPHRGVARLLLATQKERERAENRPDRERPNQATIKATKIAASGPVCESCATVMPSGALLHIHHITPISQGGRDIESNTALLCPNCHARSHWLMKKLDAANRPTDAASLLSLLKSA